MQNSRHMNHTASDMAQPRCFSIAKATLPAPCSAVRMYTLSSVHIWV
jgi:hypothetical protein